MVQTWTRDSSKRYTRLLNGETNSVNLYSEVVPYRVTEGVRMDSLLRIPFSIVVHSLLDLRHIKLVIADTKVNKNPWSHRTSMFLPNLTSTIYFKDRGFSISSYKREKII